nr:RNA methyltransferase [Pectinatus sottacetonis]
MDQLQDPGNVGTIIRTADATGINGIISLKGTVDLFSPKVVRASMGSIFHLPIIDKITVEQLQFFLQENQLQLLSTVISKNAKPCFSINYKIPSAIAFGNEGAGISPQIKKLSAENIFIPMYGQAESLNASCAAAIIMYEIMRQKHFN